MNDKLNYGFGVIVDKQPKGIWSFGSCISHSFGQTYLFINFAKWSISIGWLMKEWENDTKQTIAVYDTLHHSIEDIPYDF